MTMIHNFRSWKDFKGALPDLFGGIQPLTKKYVFRGQASADWPLASSFDRAYVGESSDRQETYLRFLRFFRVLNQRLGKKVPEADEEAGALAQHYGMPTRLLDWSLSPYAAAFFAYYYAKVERVECTHVAIWALDASALSHAIDPRHFKIIRTKSADNPRISRQVGSFVAAMGSYHDLGKYIESREPDTDLLQCCLIPMKDTDEALNDLILMGQTPADIYPDFEGVAKYVRLRMAFDGFKL